MFRLGQGGPNADGHIEPCLIIDDRPDEVDIGYVLLRSLIKPVNRMRVADGLPSGPDAIPGGDQDGADEGCSDSEDGVEETFASGEGLALSTGSRRMEWLNVLHRMRF